jgi:hypothetical protein
MLTSAEKYVNVNKAYHGNRPYQTKIFVIRGGGEGEGGMK